MFDRLDAVEQRYQQVQHDLENPSVASDQKRFRSLMKEVSDLGPIVELFRRYRKMKADREDAREMINSETDPTMKEMAKEELAQLEKDLVTTEEELKIEGMPILQDSAA